MCRQAKYLNNREEMNQALTNFTDAHNSLIQNKDDYMNNQNLGAASPWKILETGCIKQDEAHEPECSQIWWGTPKVESVEFLSVEYKVLSVECKVWSFKC